MGWPCRRQTGQVAGLGGHVAGMVVISYRNGWPRATGMGGLIEPEYAVGERRIVSVANLTRHDGEAFFRAAARIDIDTTAHTYPLAAANQALGDLREGRFAGAAVLLT